MSWYHFTAQFSAPALSCVFSCQLQLEILRLHSNARITAFTVLDIMKGEMQHMATTFSGNSQFLITLIST